MASHNEKKTLKEKLYTFLGINYEHKSSAYWYALAIPQLFLLLVILYLTGGVIVRHVYHYYNPQGDIYFPGMKALYYLGGEDIKEPVKEGVVLESNLLRDTLKSQQMEKMTRFHALVAQPELQKDTAPICFICHGDMPHRENKNVRSILNMHTEFAACLACHLDDKQIAYDKVKFQWYKPDHLVTEGAPYGTSYDPKSGELAITDDRYSKITPFTQVKEKMVSLEVPGDSPEARDYMKIRDTLSHDQQAKIKTKFHKYVAAKGVFCDRCHNPKESILDFAGLGFEEGRARDLTGLNIVGIISKYGEFHIPNIFNVSEKVAPARQDQSVYTDPRAWWRDQHIDKVEKKD